MYNILVLHQEGPARANIEKCLENYGLKVPSQNPIDYAGLGSEPVHLVIQDAQLTRKNGPLGCDVELTKRIVEDIIKSEKSISMLVLAHVFYNEAHHQIAVAFMREMVRLGDQRKYSYDEHPVDYKDLIQIVGSLLPLDDMSYSICNPPKK